jgi:hypothetical protein
MSADDLSGEWRGIFNYPASAGPATEFVAALHDRGGVLGGSVEEPNRYGGQIRATVDGRRNGAAVTFLKLYESDGGGGYDTVSYLGEVDPEGHEIAGRWAIAGFGEGSFIMVRDRGVAVAEEVEERAPLP